METFLQARSLAQEKRLASDADAENGIYPPASEAAKEGANRPPLLDWNQNLCMEEEAGLTVTT